MADLVPVGAATLRHVVEALDDPELASCWTDDMTLGWVYQYWNDPEREALDAKLNAGGKVEPHEIASKTQMFTERYMVDWLLQNSLGPMWLAMCRKHGWTADCERPLPGEPATAVGGCPKGDPPLSITEVAEPPSGVPPYATPRSRMKRSESGSEAREPGCRYRSIRATARQRTLERPAPCPRRAPRRLARQARARRGVAHGPDAAPHRRRAPLGLLRAPADPGGRGRARARDACATSRSSTPPSAPATSWWSPSICSSRSTGRRPATGARRTRSAGPTAPSSSASSTHNLHGIDLDPRAVQIAAAALWLKARRTCPEARPARLNLVASNLRLASLPDDDPALVELRREVERETGIPAELTDTVIHALAGCRPPGQPAQGRRRGGGGHRASTRRR